MFAMLRRRRPTMGQRDALRPLYAHVCAAARRPHWYRSGGVPDSVTGRFDMVASVLALVLIRLTAIGDMAAAPALLTEIFVEDMDGQLRQIGIGDLVVGKQIGQLVSTLGGRIATLRPALTTPDDAALLAFVDRNIHRGAPATPDAAAVCVAGLRAIHAALAATGDVALLAGGGDW